MKIKTDTVIRTVLLAVTLLNQILTVLGKNPLPFAEGELYSVLSSAATLCASLWAWWKNNSFTENALAADDYLASLRENK